MDKITPELRSANMRRIRSKDTKPELLVRAICRKLGFNGYRIHRRDIPGSPDIAWIGRKQAVFFNGCFWHGHSCKDGIHKPKSNAEYWSNKISSTRKRDWRHWMELADKGWSVLVIWECELRDIPKIEARLTHFVSAH